MSGAKDEVKRGPQFMTNYHHFSMQYLLIPIRSNSPSPALHQYDSRAFNPFICIIRCFACMYFKIHRYMLYHRSPAGSYLSQKHSTMTLSDIPVSLLHLGYCFELSYRISLSSPLELNTQEASISLLQWTCWCACLYLPVWEFLWVLCPRASLLGRETHIAFPWPHWRLHYQHTRSPCPCTSAT